MKSSWKLNDIEEVLRLFPEDAILCGGQAASYWASRFGLGEVVSKDVDVVAERGFIHGLMKLKGGTTYFPHEHEMTNFRGRVSFVHQGRALAVEALHSVPGLEDNPEEISIVVDLPSGGSLRVLHPVALAQSKLYNLGHFNQTERNDLHHFQIALEAARRWLAELTAESEVEVVYLLNRWFRTVRVRANLRVLRRHGIDWATLFPMVELRAAASASSRIAGFLENQWPRMQAEILARTGELKNEPEFPEP